MVLIRAGGIDALRAVFGILVDLTMVFPKPITVSSIAAIDYTVAVKILKLDVTRTILE